MSEPKPAPIPIGYDWQKALTDFLPTSPTTHVEGFTAKLDGLSQAVAAIQFSGKQQYYKDMELQYAQEHMAYILETAQSYELMQNKTNRYNPNCWDELYEQFGDYGVFVAFCAEEQKQIVNGSLYGTYNYRDSSEWVHLLMNQNPDASHEVNLQGNGCYVHFIEIGIDGDGLVKLKTTKNEAKLVETLGYMNTQGWSIQDTRQHFPVSSIFFTDVSLRLRYDADSNTLKPHKPLHYNALLHLHKQSECAEDFRTDPYIQLSLIKAEQFDSNTWVQYVSRTDMSLQYQVA